MTHQTTYLFLLIDKSPEFTWNHQPCQCKFWLFLYKEIKPVGCRKKSKSSTRILLTTYCGALWSVIPHWFSASVSGIVQWRNISCRTDMMHLRDWRQWCGQPVGKSQYFLEGHTLGSTGQMYSLCHPIDFSGVAPEIDLAPLPWKAGGRNVFI